MQVSSGSRIIAQLLLVAVVCVGYSLAEDQPIGSEPQDVVNIAGWTLRSYYNESKMRDRLRFSKSYYKYEIVAPTNHTISSGKLTYISELVNCKGANIPKRIRCRSIEQHLIESAEPDKLIPEIESVKKEINPSNEYVMRSSIRIKSNLLGKKNHHGPLVLYPLDDLYVDQYLELHKSASKIDDGFGPNALKLGYSFEFNEPRSKCGGKLFLSLNRTDLFVRFKNDPYPELLDELEYFFDQGLKNGILVLLEGPQCETTDLPLQLTWNSRLVFLLKQTFPYVTCHHNIQTSPFDTMWKYSGNITQERESESSKTYNTTIRIKSYSAFFLGLNQALEQLFIIDEDSGAMSEEMSVRSLLYDVVVKGTLSLDSWSKSFKVYGDKPEATVDSETLDILLQPADYTKEPLLSLELVDDPNEDSYKIQFKLKRNLFGTNATSDDVTGDPTSEIESDDLVPTTHESPTEYRLEL